MDNIDREIDRYITWVCDEYPEVYPGHDDLPGHVLHAQLEVLAQVPAQVGVNLLPLNR